MGEDLRVPPGPAVHRGNAFTFRFDGRRVVAHEGETVGAALHAADERVLMRSIRYHRPRGLFCNVGACASCLVRVDGVPNQRACLVPATPDLRVETQNSYPNARRDVLAVVDKVYRKNLDVHEKFARWRLIRPVFHAIVRRMAGFGRIPDATRLPPRRPESRRVETDVVVVGAGPAGLAAAVAAAEGAARVLLVDENPRAGGSLLLARAELEGARDGVDVARELMARFEDAGGEYLGRSVAFGLYRTDGEGDALPSPGALAVLSPQRMVVVHAKALVVATGVHETPPLFPGNDLPGIMGARGALILLHRHGVLPGKRVLVVGDAPLGRRAARDLARAGAEVVGIVGADALKGARVVEAHGGTRVERVTLEVEGAAREERVDCVVAAGDETPRVELLQQAGAQLVWNGACYTARVDAARTSAPGVFAVGDVLGAQDPLSHLDAGARAGEAAARHARGVPT